MSSKPNIVDILQMKFLNFLIQIWSGFIKPRETYIFCRNKLMLFLNYLKTKNKPSAPDMQDHWQLFDSTIRSHINDVIDAITRSYNDTDIISVPDRDDQKLLSWTLQMDPSKKFSIILFALDGSHKKCRGRNDTLLLSWKYSRMPCFNIMYVVDRVTEQIVVFDI
eukprot:628864_1